MKPITPFGLALYSTLVVYVVLIITLFIGVMAWIIPFFIRGTPIDNVEVVWAIAIGLACFIMVTYIVTLCYMLAWCLRKKQEKFQIHLLSKGNVVPFKGRSMIGLIFGFFWRNVVIGSVVMLIGLGLQFQLGVAPEQYAGIKFIIDILTVIPAFWWLYARPMGKTRVVFS